MVTRGTVCRCGKVNPAGSRCSCRVADDRARAAAFDARRPSARQRGYDSAWEKARVGFLRNHPRCAMCGAQASLVDHKTPHRGVQRLFWDRSNWQPLCTPCHSGRKQSIERSGASIEAQTRRMPPDLRPSAIPLVIVCGAPGAGKAAYVARQAGERDLVIDLDAIRAALSGKRLYEAGPEWTAPALDERNRLLRSLATDRSHDRAWFIVGAPTRAERDEWAAALRPERVHLVASSFASCVINLQRDPLRRAREAHFSALAAAWHRAYAADIAAVKALSFKRQEPAPC